MKKKQIIDVWREAVSKPGWHLNITDNMEAYFAPRIYEDIPSFMEVEVAYEPSELEGADVVFIGIPYESSFQIGPTAFADSGPRVPAKGTILSRSGSDLSPDYIRKCSECYSVRLNGGFCPEIAEDFQIVDQLKILDYGNVDVNSKMNTDKMARVAIEKIAEIVNAGAVPMVLGGCHEIPYPVMRAISDNTDGNIGVIVFDAHYDNDFGGRLTAANAFGKIYEDCQVETKNMVFIGINGGGSFNTPAMARLAKEVGITVFQAADVEKLGVEEVTNRALEIVSRGAERTYVSLDADVMEPVTFPAQKYPDPFGLTAGQIKTSLGIISTQAELAGFDFCTMGPAYDFQGVGGLTAAKFYIEILKGLAVKKAGI